MKRYECRYCHAIGSIDDMENPFHHNAGCQAMTTGDLMPVNDLVEQSEPEDTLLNVAETLAVESMLSTDTSTPSVDTSSDTFSGGGGDFSGAGASTDFGGGDSGSSDSGGGGDGS